MPYYRLQGKQKKKKNDDKLRMGQKLIFNTEEKSDHLSAEPNITHSLKKKKTSDIYSKLLFNNIMK